jgi:hypothetical protein
MTPQSTSVCGGGGWNSWGMAWHLRFVRGFWLNFQRGGGGRIEGIICDRAGELDHTARLLTSTTPQSTSVCGGGGWNGRGLAWHLRFVSGFSFFSGGGRIEVVIFVRVGELDRTTQSPTSKTPQSMSARGGGGWNGWGMAWHLCFVRGFWLNFQRGGIG